MNILLVEDDRLLAKGTAKLIERLSSHQVKITEEPKEVFQWCQDGAIDLVLMDINLPGSRWEGASINGTVLARLLKEDSQTERIPIILLSAYAMKNQQAELLAISKADDFWTKPITVYNELIDRMEALVK
ncbi:MAG: response regulator [Cyanobacteriota bacterium]|nr:response regulator [Cyanobacteriota bacterium]